MTSPTSILSDLVSLSHYGIGRSSGVTVSAWIFIMPFHVACIVLKCSLMDPGNDNGVFNTGLDAPIMQKSMGVTAHKSSFACLCIAPKGVLLMIFIAW